MRVRGSFKRLLSIMLVLAVIVPAMPLGARANSTLTDVTGHWAEGAIQQAVQKGYVSGYPDGTFQPNQDVTRAEFIRMLVSALNLPHSQGTSPWYQGYVAALVELGIHRESDFNTDYNKPLTRFEMVKLAIRAVDAEYQTKSASDEDPNYMVYQATEKGILQGTGAGKLSLDGTTTRAQAVAIIERILTVQSGGTLPVDKYAVASAEILWHRTNIFTVMPHFFNDPRNEMYIVDHGMRSWKMENLVLENEHFKGELMELLAIDLSDPKDPNRKLLPALDKMFTVNPRLSIPEDAYILIVRYRVDKNNKPNTYSGRMNLSFYGYEHRNEEKLNRAIQVGTTDKNYEWINSWREGTVVWVMPGSGFKMNGSLDIQFFTSNFLGSSDEDFLYNFIVTSVLPKKEW